MSGPNRFRKTTIRAKCAVTFGCYADPVFFKRNFEDLPLIAQREIEVNGPLPCEGGGRPGEWCLGCRFGEELDREDL